MKDSLSHIQIVLDRSGSMADVAEATIAGFNEFVARQKEVPGDATLTLIQFDSENPYEIVFDTKPLKEIPQLTGHTFVPRGMTPLLDAMGRSIDGLGEKLSKTPEADRPAKVFIVTVTDGLENHSKEYTKDRIAKLIKHQTDAYKWQFIFLGANQDAITVGGGYNIPTASSLTYAANPRAVRHATVSASNAVRSVRMGVASAACFTSQDRVDAMDEEEDVKMATPGKK